MAAVPFSRTLRALDAARADPWIPAIAIATLLLGLLGAWAFGARVAVYETSSDARREVRRHDGAASESGGLREPSAGLLHLRGLDARTLGPALWRRHITAAPQFHENHVLTGTLAYNLLFGRGWPPTPGDLREAEELCGALGLDGLLSRMPAGISQIVGETGWRLSHGERGRLFLARALLQGADLILLDESFAALDPETMQRCLRCAMERSGALMVIAHP